MLPHEPKNNQDFGWLLILETIGERSIDYQFLHSITDLIRVSLARELVAILYFIATESY